MLPTEQGDLEGKACPGFTRFDHHPHAWTPLLHDVEDDHVMYIGDVLFWCRGIQTVDAL